MQIGCFSLPWHKHPYERAVDGIARAGFQYMGILPKHAEQPLFDQAPGWEPKVAALRKTAEAAGLKVNVLFGMHAPLTERDLGEFKVKLDQAAALGAGELLCWGPWPWKVFHKELRPNAEWQRDVDAFFARLPEAAKHAESVGVTISFKPHCGVTASSKELTEIVRRVPSPRVRVSYDGGNVSFYEGLDPAEDIKPVAEACCSLIIKDHVGGKGVAGPGAFPNVGDGKVDHASMMRTLWKAGCRGPISIEKLAGETPEELDASAAHSRKVLEGYLEAIRKG